MPHSRTPQLGKRSQRGSTLLLVVVTLPAIIGVLGLAADLGRIYIVKNELQTFVDASSLLASLELDGTSQGLANAQAAAATGPVGATANKWDFSTKTVSNVQPTFAQTLAGPYQASPGSASGYRFVQVTASAQVQLYFLPILPGVTSPTVTATAIAGQGAESSVGEGAAPFSPDAHTPADPDFGFTIGEQYTLKWAPSGQRDKPGGRCPGDATFDPGGGSSDRGYIDVGQGNGNSALHDAIVNNDYNLAEPLTVGSSLDMVPGNKHVGPAVDERFNQDTDTVAATYRTYTGNGRRVLVVAVNNAGDPGQVVGFAAFFLPPNNPCVGENKLPCCAEYLGPAVLSGKHKGAATAAGLYKVKLFR
jgi:Flp pilus assembly protein TadG